MKARNRSASARLFVLPLSLLIALSVSPSAFAVSEAAVLSLLISPSPEANAMGGTYANTVDRSPMAAIMNPASLGMFARNNCFGTEYYPEKTPWLRILAPDFSYDATGTGFGINLEPFIKIPVSLAIGFYSIRFDMGESEKIGPDSMIPIGTFNSWEGIKGTAFALAIDYYVRASMGITFKSIESHLAPIITGVYDNPKPKAHDLGIILQIPVFDLVQRYSPIQDVVLFRLINPYLDPGFYYSKTNVGGEIYFVSDHADPLPRNLSLGVSLSAGLGYKNQQDEFSLISFKWAREVEDILIDRRAGGLFEYASGLHDIHFFNDLIKGRSNPEVITKRGLEFGLLDTFFGRQGRYVDMDGQVLYETNGYGIDYTQPFKILATHFDLERHLIVRLLTGIHFEEHFSEYSSRAHWMPLRDTRFKSYVLRLDNSIWGVVLPKSR